MATPADIKALLQSGQTDKALRLAKSWVKRSARDPNALDQLARSYLAARQPKRALATFDRLVKLLPKHARPLADRALLLQQLGRAAEANADLRRALTIEPLNGSLLRMLTVTDRLSAEDSLVQRVQTAWDAGTLKDQNKVHAGFGLAAVYGTSDLSYLHEANALQRKLHPWSMDGRLAEISALQGSFERRPWVIPKPDPALESAPIFVTGMPRSGTTLVEQILACHPQVASYGETGLPLRAVYAVLQTKRGFQRFADVSAERLTEIATRYTEAMRQRYGTNVRTPFTDKSMQSYLTIGAMQHIFPKSRCIVVQRDPRDIGWSIYRNFFEGGTHGYSNALHDIGRYYRTFHDMVSYWRRVQPDAVYELRYEELVTDPEPVIRALLDHCGLRWDAACLSPENSAQAVRTLSVDQVRSPMSPRSIGGWRQVAAELQPMLDALGDLAAPWD